MSKRNYAQMLGTAVRTGIKLYQGYNSLRNSRTSSKPSGGSIMSGAFVRRVKRRTGRVKRWSANRCKAAIIGAGNEVIYRHQGTTPTYIGPGYYNLGFNDSATPGLHYVPVHFMSLTSMLNGQFDLAKGVQATCMKQVYYDNATGLYAYSDMFNQEPNGSSSVNNQWKTELSNLTTNTVSSVFHKYTDIKINLYGSYTVPVWFNVFICTMKEQIDPLKTAPNTYYAADSETNNMFRDMMRPLTYSTVGHNSYIKFPADMRVIKSHRVCVQPLGYSDQEAEKNLDGDVRYSKSPNIHELRWFIRHDRYRDYKWTQGIYDSLLNNNDLNAPQWDVVTPRIPMCDVEWGKKLFLFITASAPTRGLATTTPYRQDASHTIQQGSYDICVRNCFRQFSY